VMIRILCAMAALLTLSPAMAQSTGPSATVLDIVHRSAALERDTTYTIILPPGLSASVAPDTTTTRYPVLYLLHGYSGNHRDWADKTSITQLAAIKDSIIVLPDGNFDSWWIDSPLKPQSRFSTYLTEDLRNDVENRWPVRRDRSGRSIAGLSMGGHGALLNATRRPELYASASSMSGILDLRVYPKNWGIPAVVTSGSREILRNTSFVGAADSLRAITADQAPALLFDCGTSDTAAIEANRRAHEALTNRALHHQFREFPGIHSWQYWNARLPEHLAFHASVRAGLDGKGPRVDAGPRPSERWRDSYSTRTLGYEAENEKIWIPIAQNPNAPETSRPIVLLGSSSFEIKDIRSTLPGYPVAYRGISADRLGLGERGLLQRLHCSAIDLQPRAVFILNGTNDLGSLSTPGGPTMADLQNIYEEIVVRILKGSPRTKVFVVSLSPLRDSYLRLVPQVKPFNDGIAQLATRYPDRVKYVDQWSGLHDGTGVLKQEFSRDGLHLNAEGYKHLGKVLREALASENILP
jgi:putative tributyrin esterase